MSTNQPTNLLNDPEQIKLMITMLSQMLEQTQNKDESEQPANDMAEPTNNIQSKSKSQVKNKKSQHNKFLDMPEFNMDKEDPELASKLYQHPPTSRNRKSQQSYVSCRICGKREKVSASILYGGADRYKCNKCSGSAG